MLKGNLTDRKYNQLLPRERLGLRSRRHQELSLSFHFQEL